MIQTQNISELKVVIFDWDNTLVASSPALEFCVNQVLQKYGLPEWDISKQKRDDTLSFRDNFPRIFGYHAKEAYEDYRNIYLKNAKRYVKVFDGVYEIIQLLKKNKKKLIIMSNKDRLLLDYEYKLFFEDDDFCRIVCGHEARHDKPHEDQLFYCLEGIIAKEDANENSVWMVGDSPVDSECAKRSGVRAVRVGSPLWDEDDENDEKISYFKSMKDFHDFVKNTYGEMWN